MLDIKPLDFGQLDVRPLSIKPLDAEGSPLARGLGIAPLRTENLEILPLKTSPLAIRLLELGG